MNQFNLFTWIREGVKQSVLLGVSDAIDAVGMPDDSEDIAPKLMSFIKNGSTTSERNTGSSTGRRKRLGRTLKDMNSGEET